MFRTSSRSRKGNRRFVAAAAAASIVGVGLPITVLSLNAGAAIGAVSGTVFRDVNENGVKDIGEVGVAKLWVRAFGQTNGADGLINTADDVVSTYGPVLTSATGAWNIPSVTTDSKVRVEFLGLDNGDATFQAGETNLPSWLKSTAVGADNNTSVQFVPLDTNTMKYGVANPYDYCQANPDVAIACLLGGDPTAHPLPSLKRFASNNPTTTTDLATSADIGSTFGRAIQKSSKNIYSSAFLKRFAGMGTGGPGAIYQTTPGGTTTLLATVPNAGVVADNTSRSLGVPRIGDEPLIPANNDPTVFDKIGKQSLGGLDFAEDDKTLWVMNLNDKSLYTADASTPGATATLVSAVPNGGCGTTGLFKPFAVKYQDGKVYVGGVCDAENSQLVADLVAKVYVYDPAATTWSSEVLTIPLNPSDYSKGCATATPNQGCGWKPWAGSEFLGTAPDYLVSYPQPWLTDIDFDVTGTMIIGLRDRSGDQYGHSNANLAGTGLVSVATGGDIVRAKANGDGTFTLESNGNDGTNSGSGGGNGEGPGGGEFYSGDVLVGAHNETSQGAMLQIKNSPDVLAVVMDPIVNRSGGTARFSNSTGAKTQPYEITSAGSVSPTVQAGTFGKAGSLGDIAAFCDEAPIEIGNRVWLDSNGDGVQDPNEAPIGGVNVNLYEGSATVPTATTTTNATTGEYYFTGLKPKTNYRVEIDTTQTAVSAYTPTTANSATAPDTIDSDGVVSTGKVAASVTTGPAGTNDHTIDFGFKPTYDLALINLLTDPPTAANGMKATYTLRIKNQGSLPSGNFTVTDTLPTGLTYDSSSDANTRVGQVVTWNLTGLAPGQVREVTVVVSVPTNNSTTAKNYRNWAEISADSGVDQDSTPDTNTGADATAPLNEPVVDRTLAADVDTDLGPTDEDDNDLADFSVPGVTPIYDLALVTVLTGTPTAGGNATFTIRVKNQGNVDSGNFTVTNTLPSGLTYVSSSDSGANAGQIVTWNLSGLAAGTTRDLTVVASVPAGSVGTFKDWAEISADSGTDPDSTPDTNTGADTNNPNDLVVDRTQLADVDTDLGATDEDDNDPASFTLVAAPKIDLALAKSIVTAAPYYVGGNVQFKLTVTNNGPATAATGFTITDTLPAGLTWATTQPTNNGYSCVVTGQTIVCTSDHALATGPDNIVVDAILGSSVTGSLRNIAYVSPAVGDASESNVLVVPPAGTDTTTTNTNNDAHADVTITDKIDLALTKVADASNGTIVSGRTTPVTFTLTVTNNGPAAAKAGYTVKDTLPTGLTFTGLPNGTAAGTGVGFTCAAVGNTVTCTSSGPLASGASATITVNAILTATGGSMRNVAEVLPEATDVAESVPAGTSPVPGTGTGATPSGTLSSGTPTNNDADAVIVVGAAPVQPIDLTLTKTLVPAAVFNPGSPVDFTLQVGNSGSGIAKAGYTVTDILPVGLTFDATNPASSTGFTCAAPVAQEVTCTATGALNPGASAPLITIKAKVNANATGSLHNVGYVTPEATDVTETNQLAIPTTTTNTANTSTNNDAQADVSITPLSINLKLAKRLTSATPVAPNASVQFELTVTNEGPGTAKTGFTVTDLLPAGLSFAVIAPAAGTGYICGAPIAQSITCTSDHPLAVGTIDTITINATADANASGALKNVAYVAPAAGDNETNPLGAAPTSTTDTAASTTDNDGEASVSVNQPAVLKYSVGNQVWNDVNNNGIIDGTEAGIDGVTVRLLDANGAAVAGQPDQQTTTGGYYLFVNLGAGTYQVEVVPPAGYTTSTGTDASATGPFETAPNVDTVMTDSDDNGSTLSSTALRSSQFVLGSSEPLNEPVTPGHADTTPDNRSDYTVDFGIFQPASLGDVVWNDVNTNGIQDANETGVTGVKVNLLDASGAVVATTTTTASGNYRFTNLTPAKTYSVEFVKSTLPAGFVFTTTGAGAEDTDSNADVTTGKTKTYVMAAGEYNSTVDAGIYLPVVGASLGDRVWNDANNNGIQDSGETGVAGVKVNLLDATGAVLATTTTDASGLYSFANLTPGKSYVVEFVKSTLPAGFVFSPTGAGTDATDSNADATTGRTRAYVLAAGENNTTVDAGAYKPAAITTTTIGQTIQVTTTTVAPTTTTVGAPTTTTVAPAIPSTTSTGVATTTSTTVAVAKPTGRIGDTVWNDANGNGKQDKNEKGIAYAVVVLTLPDGSTRKAITDANGTYIFDGLAAGAYKVEVAATTTPTNGPRLRMVKLDEGQAFLDADYGFTNAGVLGVQIERPDGAVDGAVAFTGSESLLLISCALMLMGAGGLVVNRRRKQTR